MKPRLPDLNVEQRMSYLALMQEERPRREGWRTVVAAGLTLGAMWLLLAWLGIVGGAL